MSKDLPRDITSYDLLKSAAIILMLIDHAGYYFFPDEQWLRVFGRFCVPVWFFLIGYARSRDLGVKLWAGIAILLAANIVTGMSLFPLNILATMIAVRVLIDPLARFGARGRWAVYLACAVMAALAIPSGMVAEYGTVGLMMAYFGWLARHRDEQPEGDSRLKEYMVLSYIAFFVLQVFNFGFEGAKLYAFCAGTAAVMALLFYFTPRTYPVLTQRIGKLPSALLRFTGRHTAEIYVAHLILYKVLGLLLIPDRQVLFDWKFFSMSGF